MAGWVRRDNMYIRESECIGHGGGLDRCMGINSRAYGRLVVEGGRSGWPDG